MPAVSTWIGVVAIFLLLSEAQLEVSAAESCIVGCTTLPPSLPAWVDFAAEVSNPYGLPVSSTCPGKVRYGCGPLTGCRNGAGLSWTGAEVWMTSPQPNPPPSVPFICTQADHSWGGAPGFFPTDPIYWVYKKCQCASFDSLPRLTPDCKGDKGYYSDEQHEFPPHNTPVTSCTACTAGSPEAACGASKWVVSCPSGTYMVETGGQATCKSYIQTSSSGLNIIGNPAFDPGCTGVSTPALPVGGGCLDISIKWTEPQVIGTSTPSTMSVLYFPKSSSGSPSFLNSYEPSNFPCNGLLTTTCCLDAFKAMYNINTDPFLPSSCTDPFANDYVLGNYMTKSKVIVGDNNPTGEMAQIVLSLQDLKTALATDGKYSFSNGVETYIFYLGLGQFTKTPISGAIDSSTSQLAVTFTKSDYISYTTFGTIDQTFLTYVSVRINEVLLSSDSTSKFPSHSP